MSLKSEWRRMRSDIRSAYKSEDTEEFFDRIFTKPLGYLWARLFMRLGWTPNMVTLLSMAIGFAGGWLFYPENFKLNLIGVLLVIWANILDSTDGQLARLTGHKSTLGRILDALSTGVWYVAIDCALCLRLMPKAIPFSGGRPWGGLIWLVVIVCEFAGHQKQCMLADYYRNIHLFFLKNKNGSELDRSRDIARARAKLPWKGARFQKLYLYFYGLYTRLQELSTPSFQRLFKAIEENGGEVDEAVRQDYLAQSRKYIQLTNILTFNTRAYTLFLLVLLGAPILFFPIELFAFGGLMLYMRAKYEAIAENILYAHRLPGSETPPVKRKKYPVVFFVIGVIGIIAMLARTDMSQVDWSGTILSKMPIWLPSLIALWAVVYILHTLAYRAIMGWDMKSMPFWRLLKMTISGFSLNQVTPMGLVGGEPYRIMEMKPYIGLEKATATTLTFSVMHVFSHVMLWLTGAFVYLLLGCPGGVLATLADIAALGLCALALFAFFRSGKRGLVMPLMRFLCRVPWAGKFFAATLEKKRESFEAIDRDMTAFHGRRRDFAATLLLEYVGRLMEVGELFIIFRVMQVDVSFAGCAVALSCASLIGNLVFFIPMQVGSREAGMALALGWMGLAPSVSITASLLTRMREIFYLAVGVGALLLTGGSPEDAEAAASSEDEPASCEDEAASADDASNSAKPDSPASGESEEVS